MQQVIKVSVIVPVYNVEKYLRKCVDSLVNQHLREMEVILVNDGSTDDSQKIIDEYSANYPTKIISLIKQNGGLSAARNFGLAAAKGDYIGFVDGDDFVDAAMFAELHDLAVEHNADLAICNLQKVDPEGELIEKLPQIPHLPEKIRLQDHFSIFSDLSYFACNKIFRRDLFDGLKFKEGIHFEDIQLIPQLLLRSTVIVNSQKYHYQYVQRTDSITRTHTVKGLDILRAVADVETAFNQSKFADRRQELQNFKILEGVYTYLAYLAYVQDPTIYKTMSLKLKEFIAQNKISLSQILRYRRFDRNYLLSLPLKKKIYYLLFFFGQEKILRRLL